MAFCAIASAGAAGAQGLWDDPAFALYRQAVEAMNGKDYDRADRLAGEAIEQYPDHVLAHYLRGQAALAQSRWEAAIAAFSRVIALYPGSFAAHAHLGSAAQELGRTDEAARAYRAALALRPDDDAIRARLALMLDRAGQRDEAAQLLQELARRETRLPEVWIALGRRAYDEGKLADAEQAFARAAALRDDGPTWFNLGVIRLRLDNRDGAREAFQHAAAHADTRERATAELDRLSGRARNAPGARK